MEGYKLGDNLPGIDQVLTKNGQKTLAEVVEGYKFYAIYFSAHWCPPCRNFTPVLSQFYEEVNKDGAKNLQIVFLTSDKDDAAFQGYYETMPWVAVPFDFEGKQAVKQQHGVEGIPMLPVFNNQGVKIVDNGREVVHQAQDEGKQSDLIATWSA